MYRPPSPRRSRGSPWTHRCGATACGKPCRRRAGTPGDVVELSLGGVVAADVHLLGDEILLDQSMFTGESIPIEVGAEIETYAGRWYGAAKQWPKSPRPERAPSSAEPQSSSAPPCGECATEGGSAREAQSRPVLWHRHHGAGGLCLLSRSHPHIASAVRWF